MNIHLIEKKNLFKLIDKENNICESGYWHISKETADKLINGNIYLHKNQKEPSYCGGVILSYRIQSEGEYSGRKVFIFKALESHKNKETGKTGWSMEKKIEWDKVDLPIDSDFVSYGILSLMPSVKSKGMNTAAIRFADEVYSCRSCVGLGFKSPEQSKGYYKFPPTIGALGQAPLLFVGINPRISNTNRPLHDRMMADLRAFEALAGNRVGSQKYIVPDGLEKHYKGHVEIANSVYPKKAFEEVAAVTELFLCAKEDSVGLPIQDSPCARKYSSRTVSIIKPRVIIPVGKMAYNYFLKRSLTKNEVFKTGIFGTPLWVVPMSHPSARVKDQKWSIEWTIRKVKEVLRDTELDDKSYNQCAK
jgi:hypothetical protein